MNTNYGDLCVNLVDLKQEFLPMIQNITLDKWAITVNINQSKNKFENFDVGGFLARYLCGNKGLKELRLISRKRLALESSGIGYTDVEAFYLNTQINKYNQAKEYLTGCEKWTLDDILTINKILTPEIKKSGQLRDNQNWITGQKGEDIENALYICPSPEFVPDLMANWLEFINEDEVPVEIRIIVGHAQLVNIHPFCEGNGRAARAFIDALIAKHCCATVNPMLYRLYLKARSHDTDSYIKSIDRYKTNLNEHFFEINYHEFWEEGFTWANGLFLKIEFIVSQTRAKINNRLGLQHLSPNTKKLLDHLWQQPVICEMGLYTTFGWDSYVAHETIKELCHANILETRRLRTVNNSVIYDCPLIFNAWLQIDDSISESMCADAG